MTSDAHEAEDIVDADEDLGEENTEDEVVRQEHFDVDGPLDIDISLSTGRVTIMLVDEPGASVELRNDPTGGNAWMQGFSNILNWVNEQFGAQFGGPESGLGELPSVAIREARIEQTDRRLVVHGPKRQLQGVPLAVTVRAPSGSSLDLRNAAANVTVTGTADRVRIHSGSGDVSLDRADGSAEIHTGSGALRLGPMLGGLNARSGSGEIEVSSVGGPTTVVTGTGDVWLGAVQSDIMARTGSGDLTIADAASGDVELITGSGEIRIGVRSGTPAQVDLSSGSGQARSELDVADRPPAGGRPALRLRGRTRSGNAVVTAAVG
jgi:hypothetical protein